jgi:predicted dithiol-disulfide oxidoreductase (DUF899 family)
MIRATDPLSTPKVVPREQWLAARKAVLATEKVMARELDALRTERRRLQSVKVGKLKPSAVTFRIGEDRASLFLQNLAHCR